MVDCILILEGTGGGAGGAQSTEKDGGRVGGDEGWPGGVIGGLEDLKLWVGGDWGGTASDSGEGGDGGVLEELGEDLVALI